MGRRLIGLTGFARTGKDTVAAVLSDQGYRRISFADKVRAMAYALNPWVPDGDKDMVRLRELVDRVGWERAKDSAEVRRYLQDLGTHARLLLGEDVWVRAAMKDVWLSRSYVFSDVRHPNEADAIVAKGGEIWRVVRPGYGPVNDHLTETALDGYRVDFTLVNDCSLPTLHKRVRAALLRPKDDQGLAEVVSIDPDWPPPDPEPTKTVPELMRELEESLAKARAAKRSPGFTGGPSRWDVV